MNRLALTARTVIVGTRSVDSAYRSLNAVIMNEGIALKLRMKRHYETPTKKRERREYEKCLRLYNREMKKKVQFVMKKHEPLPTM